jgi:hypothetical protein
LLAVSAAEGERPIAREWPPLGNVICKIARIRVVKLPIAWPERKTVNRLAPANGACAYVIVRLAV